MVWDHAGVAAGGVGCQEGQQEGREWAEGVSLVPVKLRGIVGPEGAGGVASGSSAEHGGFANAPKLQLVMSVKRRAHANVSCLYIVCMSLTPGLYARDCRPIAVHNEPALK